MCFYIIDPFTNLSPLIRLVSDTTFDFVLLTVQSSSPADPSHPEIVGLPAGLLLIPLENS